MKKLDKNFVFYFVIMEENEQDHILLQNIIHSFVPQAIIESIYDFNEALSFFREKKLMPHVLFISDTMSKAALSIASDGSISNVNTETLPLVLLTDQQTRKSNSQKIFSKPFDTEELFSLVASVNYRWVA